MLRLLLASALLLAPALFLRAQLAIGIHPVGTALPLAGQVENGLTRADENRNFARIVTAFRFYGTLGWQRGRFEILGGMGYQRFGWSQYYKATMEEVHAATGTTTAVPAGDAETTLRRVNFTGNYTTLPVRIRCHFNKKPGANKFFIGWLLNPVLNLSYEADAEFVMPDPEGSAFFGGNTKAFPAIEADAEDWFGYNLSPSLFFMGPEIGLRSKLKDGPWSMEFSYTYLMGMKPLHRDNEKPRGMAFDLGLRRQF